LLSLLYFSFSACGEIFPQGEKNVSFLTGFCSLIDKIPLRGTLCMKFNKKFLWMFHGPGGGFFKKSPLAAGGKVK
jgi:hypothetical protein